MYLNLHGFSGLVCIAHHSYASEDGGIGTASLCVLAFHLIRAKVKPVETEQEGMCTQGLKVKSLRKVVSRKLSEKED